MNEVSAIQFPERKGPTRLGRPRGSTGHQPERFKHQVASLVVLGKRNIEIARELNVSSKSVRLWLRHPAVQREIKELEEDVHRSTERLLAGLFRASVRRMSKIIRKGEAKLAVHAIQLLWSAHGRIPAGNDEGGRGGGIIDQRPVFIRDHQDARAAMALLKAERRRLEREEAEKQEGRRPPAEPAANPFCAGGSE